MENFFYDDSFCSDLEDLMRIHDIEEDEDVSELPEDWSVECFESKEEKIVTLSAGWIIERMDEERFPEDSDRVDQKVSKALSAIDFDKVNELMPSLWYPTKKKFTVTKADLIEYISPSPLSNK